MGYLVYNPEYFSSRGLQAAVLIIYIRGTPITNNAMGTSAISTQLKRATSTGTHFLFGTTRLLRAVTGIMEPNILME